MSDRPTRCEAFSRSQIILRTWKDPRCGKNTVWSVYVTPPAVNQRRVFIRRFWGVYEDWVNVLERNEYCAVRTQSDYMTIADAEVPPEEYDRIMEEGQQYLIPILGFTDGRGLAEIYWEEYKEREAEEKRKGYYSSAEEKPKPGATYGIEFKRNVATVRLTWWWNEPKEWREFTGWVKRFQKFLDSHVEKELKVQAALKKRRPSVPESGLSAGGLSPAESSDPTQGTLFDPATDIEPGRLDPDTDPYPEL